MNYFYVTDDDKLIPLASFQFSEGQSQVVRIPGFGATAYTRTRKEPDRFNLVMKSALPHLGQFNVVDENCVIYGCIGQTISNRSVSGIVVDRCEVETQHKAEALQAMRSALSDRTLSG